MVKLRRTGKWRAGAYTSSLSIRDAPSSPETVGERIGVVIVVGMFACAGIVGVLALWAGISQYAAGALPLGNTLLAIALGLAFATLGFGFFYFRYVKKPLWDAQKARIEARYPDQPWMLRNDWASRRIVHSNAGVVIVLRLWNVGWWGGLILIGSINRDKILASLESSYWGYLLLAFFVLCGIAVLRLAIEATWSHWRYGRSVLRLDTLPAFSGERLRGTIEAGLTARPRAPLKASLVCERVKWTEYRSNGRTRTRAEVKEQSRMEREVTPASILVSYRGARIPIEFDIPSSSPEYAIDEQGNGIRWTLHLETSQAETPPFSCAFEVPVYRRREKAVQT